MSELEALDLPFRIMCVLDEGFVSKRYSSLLLFLAAGQTFYFLGNTPKDIFSEPSNKQFVAVTCKAKKLGPTKLLNVILYQTKTREI